VSQQTADGAEARESLLALYDLALPQVYGYLLSRCGRASLAEDLTSQTFMAAVDAVRRDVPTPVSMPWLIGVARHKLVDHWRRLGREERGLQAVASEQDESLDSWDIQLDGMAARATLEQLGPHHRAALTLRYLDDLPVAEVASILRRTVHATEGLLVRARRAFRAAYLAEGCRDG
jgi:RNA polymerase sigma-70 factor (ECF subfamily)